MSKNLERTTRAYIGPNISHHQFVQKITNEKVFIYLMVRNKDSLFSTFHKNIEEARKQGAKEFAIAIVTKVISPTQFKGINIRHNESNLIAKDFQEFQSQIYGKSFTEVHRIFVDYMIGLFNEIIAMHPRLKKHDYLSYKKNRDRAFSNIGLDILPRIDTGGTSPLELKNRLNDLEITRHLLEHNNGIVDKHFLERVSTTTYKLGERINIGSEQIGEVIALVETIAEDLNKRALKKFWPS